MPQPMTVRRADERTNNTPNTAAAIAHSADFTAEQNVSKVRDVIAQMSLELAAISGEGFLTQYALSAAKSLDADFFIVSRLNPYSNIMRTVRFVVDGEMAENISYSLDGTPCARAVGGGSCVYTDKVAELFPHDKFLRDYGVEGYAGAPLNNAKGDTLGVVVAMTKKPIIDQPLAKTVLEHFSDRIAFLIEAAEMMDRYRWAVMEATDGVWDWDVVTGGTTISESLRTMLGNIKGNGPYDLSQIESAMHPDERGAHVEALRRHLNEGAPFNVRVRLRNRDGDYRWCQSRGKAVRNVNGKAVRFVGCFSDIHDLMTVRDGK